MGLMRSELSVKWEAKQPPFYSLPAGYLSGWAVKLLSRAREPLKDQCEKCNRCIQKIARFFAYVADQSLTLKSSQKPGWNGTVFSLFLPDEQNPSKPTQ
ncbi:MAG: hypothetical protein WCE63_00335 [Acidobacteriaceae bacterium]